MSTIKISHIHESGKKCFVSSPKYEKTYIISGMGPDFAIGFYPYSSHWYAFDIETGREIGSFTKEFFERHLPTWRMRELVPDPDCKVVK